MPSHDGKRTFEIYKKINFSRKLFFSFGQATSQVNEKAPWNVEKLRPFFIISMYGTVWKISLKVWENGTPNILSMCPILYYIFSPARFCSVIFEKSSY